MKIFDTCFRRSIPIFEPIKNQLGVKHLGTASKLGKTGIFQSPEDNKVMGLRLISNVYMNHYSGLSIIDTRTFAVLRSIIFFLARSESLVSRAAALETDRRLCRLTHHPSCCFVRYLCLTMGDSCQWCRLAGLVPTSFEWQLNSCVSQLVDVPEGTFEEPLWADRLPFLQVSVTSTSTFPPRLTMCYSLWLGSTYELCSQPGWNLCTYISQLSWVPRVSSDL
ncbi:hypothetical protein V8F20_003106 [Naviculisporaceae sp. PSN 640]